MNRKHSINRQARHDFERAFATQIPTPDGVKELQARADALTRIQTAPQPPLADVLLDPKVKPETAVKRAAEQQLMSRFLNEHGAPVQSAVRDRIDRMWSSGAQFDVMCSLIDLDGLESNINSFDPNVAALSAEDAIRADVADQWNQQRLTLDKLEAFLALRSKPVLMVHAPATGLPTLESHIRGRGRVQSGDTEPHNREYLLLRSLSSVSKIVEAVKTGGLQVDLVRSAAEYAERVSAEEGVWAVDYYQEDGRFAGRHRPS